MFNCARCGWEEGNHGLLHIQFVLPFPSFRNPRKASGGYHQSLIACEGFRLPKERGTIPHVEHSIPAVFVLQNGRHVVIDIGS